MNSLGALSESALRARARRGRRAFALRALVPDVRPALAAAVLLALAPGVLLAQRGEPEITMQVLDDLSGVEGVLMQLEEAPAESRDLDTRRDDEPAPARVRGNADEAARELERDEARTGELEDFDVPDDIQIQVP
jgi:hypothetical protein